MSKFQKREQAIGWKQMSHELAHMFGRYVCATRLQHVLQQVSELVRIKVVIAIAVVVAEHETRPLHSPQTVVHRVRCHGGQAQQQLRLGQHASPVDIQSDAQLPADGWMIERD